MNYETGETHGNQRPEPVTVTVTECINTSMEEMGLIDIWRDFHPLERHYRHYSVRHSVYSRIDYFFNEWR